MVPPLNFSPKSHCCTPKQLTGIPLRASPSKTCNRVLDEINTKLPREVPDVATTIADISFMPRRSPRLYASNGGALKRSADSLDNNDESTKRARTERVSPTKSLLVALPKGIPDRLLNNLDIVFCGINPGLTSEGNKLHFSGPGNKFYDCLKYAQFITPDAKKEQAPDFPRRFSIGLTDLVVRATASAKNIKVSEKRESVPPLLHRIFQCRPRIVCFVSIDIGKVVSEVVSCPWRPPQAPREAKARKTEDKDEPAQNLADVREYMLGFKLKYSEVDTGNVTETLFFALPSTSGANACSYYPSDKKALFQGLHYELQLIKQGSPNALDTSSFRIIDAASLIL